MSRNIGPYELGSALGSGTYSKVRIGTNKETGVKCAIKIMDKEQVKEEKAEGQVNREVSLLRRLDHPNVVRLFDLIDTPSHMYIVLELVSGGDLLGTIEDGGRFEEPLSRKFFQELIAGLDHCHRKGIAHRDLKADNLLLDPDTGMVKISDFGLANTQPRHDGGGDGLMHTVCGTPNYVAPEVLREEGYNGFSADMWSCGVILHYMLTGLLPFEDDDMSGLFKKIETGTYTVDKSVSAEANDLVARCLTVDATKRIDIKAVTKHPWFSVGFGERNLMDSGASESKTSSTAPQKQERQREEQPPPTAKRPSSSAPKPETKIAPAPDPAPAPSPPTQQQQQTSSPRSLTKSALNESNLSANNNATAAPAATSGSSAAKKSSSPESTAAIAAPDAPMDGMSLIFHLLQINFDDLSSRSKGGMTHDRRRRFATFAGPFDKAKQSLLAALEALRCNPKTLSNTELKGFSNQKKGLLTYEVQLLSTVSSNLTVVILKLGRGDENDFGALFTQLVQQLGPALSSTYLSGS